MTVCLLQRMEKKQPYNSKKCCRPSEKGETESPPQPAPAPLVPESSSAVSLSCVSGKQQTSPIPPRSPDVPQTRCCEHECHLASQPPLQAGGPISYFCVPKSSIGLTLTATTGCAQQCSQNVPTTLGHEQTADLADAVSRKVADSKAGSHCDTDTSTVPSGMRTPPPSLVTPEGTMAGSLHPLSENVPVPSSADLITRLSREVLATTDQKADDDSDVEFASSEERDEDRRSPSQYSTADEDETDGRRKEKKRTKRKMQSESALSAGDLSYYSDSDIEVVKSKGKCIGSVGLAMMTENAEALKPVLIRQVSQDEEVRVVSDEESDEHLENSKTSPTKEQNLQNPSSQLMTIDSFPKPLDSSDDNYCNLQTTSNEFYSKTPISSEDPFGKAALPQPSMIADDSCLEPPMTGDDPCFELPMTGGDPCFEPPMTGGNPCFKPPMTPDDTCFKPPKTADDPCFKPPMTPEDPCFKPPKTPDDPCFKPPMTPDDSCFKPPKTPGDPCFKPPMTPNDPCFKPPKTPDDPRLHPRMTRDDPRLHPRMTPNDPCFKPPKAPDDPCLKPQVTSADPCLKPPMTSGDPCSKSQVIPDDPCLHPRMTPDDPRVHPRMTPDDPCLHPRVTPDDPRLHPRMTPDDPRLHPRMTPDDPCFKPPLTSNDNCFKPPMTPEDPCSKNRMISNEPVPTPLNLVNAQAEKVLTPDYHHEAMSYAVPYQLHSKVPETIEDRLEGQKTAACHPGQDTKDVFDEGTFSGTVTHVKRCHTEWCPKLLETDPLLGDDGGSTHFDKRQRNVSNIDVEQRDPMCDEENIRKEQYYGRSGDEHVRQDMWSNQQTQPVAPSSHLEQVPRGSIGRDPCFATSPKQYQENLCVPVCPPAPRGTPLPTTSTNRSPAYSPSHFQHSSTPAMNQATERRYRQAMMDALAICEEELGPLAATLASIQEKIQRLDICQPQRSTPTANACPSANPECSRTPPTVNPELYELPQDPQSASGAIRQSCCRYCGLQDTTTLSPVARMYILLARPTGHPDREQYRPPPPRTPRQHWRHSPSRDVDMVDACKDII